MNKGEKYYEKALTPPHENLKFNVGFTLAEVLITLVIIGVIAAITIPMITANARRQETSARLKKFYSAISQASIRAKADGNDWEFWAESAIGDASDLATDTVENFAKEFLFPYLNYTESKSGDGGNYYIYLTDGSYFILNKGFCIDFVIDVNGEKKPNEGGKDVFDFLYCPYSNSQYIASGKFIPYLYKNDNRESALEHCKASPYTCSGLLSLDGWEFKDDYPFKL